MNRSAHQSDRAVLVECSLVARAAPVLQPRSLCDRDRHRRRLAATRRHSRRDREPPAAASKPTSIRCCRLARRFRTSPCRASTARRTRAASTAARKVLAVVFESNHCPVSQLYEGRIEKLYEDYRKQGRHARRDQPEQRQGGSAQRAGIHRRHRLAAGDEDCARPSAASTGRTSTTARPRRCR